MTISLISQYEIAKTFAEWIDFSCVFIKDSILDDKVNEVVNRVIKARKERDPAKINLDKEVKKYSSYIELLIKGDIGGQIFLKACNGLSAHEIAILRGSMGAREIDAEKPKKYAEIIRHLINMDERLQQFNQQLSFINSNDIQVTDLENIVTSLALPY